MAKAQREKGLRRERQITARLNDLGLEAERISQPYKSGPDLTVKMPTGKTLSGEVKGRAKGSPPFPTIRGMFGNPPADALFLVEDGQDPLVVLRWEAFRTLICEVLNGKQHLGPTGP